MQNKIWNVKRKQICNIVTALSHVVRKALVVNVYIITEGWDSYQPVISLQITKRQVTGI